jgi:hypothetical protein
VRQNSHASSEEVTHFMPGQGFSNLDQIFFSDDLLHFLNPSHPDLFV